MGVLPVPEAFHPLDTCVKALIREVPEALFRLAGLPCSGPLSRREDTAIQLPEQRADHVFVLGNADDPNRCGLYLEYQLRPDARLLPNWFAKCGALGRQLGAPVLLLVIYLEKGNRATFPESYIVRIGPPSPTSFGLPPSGSGSMQTGFAAGNSGSWRPSWCCAKTFPMNRQCGGRLN